MTQWKFQLEEEKGLFSAKEAFETGVETANLTASVNPEQVLGSFFSPSKHEMRLKEVHAGFRPALLKHAPCSLPTEAGPTLLRSSLCIFGAQKVSHLLFHLQFRYEDLTTTLQDWGAKVRAVHIAGSYWAPGFANYLILLQVFYQQAKSPSFIWTYRVQIKQEFKSSKIIYSKRSRVQEFKNRVQNHKLVERPIKMLWKLGSLLPDVLLQVKYLNTSSRIPRIVITSHHHDPMTIVD